MGMPAKTGSKAKPMGGKGATHPMGDQVTITLSTTDAQNLLLALTTALGGGDGKDKKKKKKKDVKEPPFGK